MKQPEFSNIAAETVNWIKHLWKNILQCLLKLNIHIIHDPEATPRYIFNGNAYICLTTKRKLVE